MLVAAQSTGAAFVAARARECCYPEGVFLSINVDTQTWALTSNIDVANPSSMYLSGAYSFEANTWHNLVLSVVGTLVSAWVDGNQVRSCACVCVFRPCMALTCICAW